MAVLAHYRWLWGPMSRSEWFFLCKWNTLLIHSANVADLWSRQCTYCAAQMPFWISYYLWWKEKLKTPNIYLFTNSRIQSSQTIFTLLIISYLLLYLFIGCLRDNAWFSFGLGIEHTHRWEVGLQLIQGTSSEKRIEGYIWVMRRRRHLFYLHSLCFQGTLINHFLCIELPNQKTIIYFTKKKIYFSLLPDWLHPISLPTSLHLQSLYQNI